MKKRKDEEMKEAKVKIQRLRDAFHHFFVIKKHLLLSKNTRN